MLLAIMCRYTYFYVCFTINIDIPSAIACDRHSCVVLTSFLALSETSPTKNVSLRSPWKPPWNVVISTEIKIKYHDNIQSKLNLNENKTYKNYKKKNTNIFQIYEKHYTCNKECKNGKKTLK